MNRRAAATDVCGALLVIVGAVLASSLLAAGATRLLAALSVEGTVGSLVVLFVATHLFGLGGVAAAYTWARDGNFDLFNFELQPARDAALAAGLSVGLFLVALGAGYALQLAGYGTADNAVMGLVGDDPMVIVALVIVSLVAIGPGEELLFRGVIQGTFRRYVSAVPAILLASILFGLFHYTSLSGTLEEKALYMLVVVVLSLVLGAAYEYTENLWVPAVAHGMYDALLFVAVYASMA